MQEAEDLVNDTALLEYSSAFGPTPAAVQVGRPSARGPARVTRGYISTSTLAPAAPLPQRKCIQASDTHYTHTAMVAYKHMHY